MATPWLLPPPPPLQRRQLLQLTKPQEGRSNASSLRTKPDLAGTPLAPEAPTRLESLRYDGNDDQQ